MSSILTFYSYKGGVGRTMAVANIAVLLARKGLRVLVVDWDLEAPGLHRYFPSLKDVGNSGLLDLLLDAGELQKVPSWSQYATTVTVEDSTRMTILTAGKFDENYDQRLLSFDWVRFFQQQNGGAILESLRQLWIRDFDVTLIDSRTGITDSGGVCTVQMPDILVPVFSPNLQSLEGTKQVVLKAQLARQKLAYDRTRLLVFPLISRFDSRTEYRESQYWLRRFAGELEDFYRDWLPKDTSPLQMLERTKLPYVAFFSFGEKLPVLTEGTTDPESLGFAYQNAATLIANDFRDADKLLLPPSTGPSIDGPSRPPIDESEWVKRIEQAIAAAKLTELPSFGLSAAPRIGVDIPGLVQSQKSPVVKLLEHPPELRSHGFDLTVSMPPELAPGGKMRRAVRPKHKLLELWRDGCLIFIADGGDGFLCWPMQQMPMRPRQIHTLVLAESAMLFCTLAQAIYKEAVPHPRSVQYTIEFRNLTDDKKNPLLAPNEVQQYPWFGAGPHVAPYGGERFVVQADPDEDPAIAAFRLVSEVYVWFGIEEDQIPYAVDRNGQRMIDVEKLRNVH